MSYVLNTPADQQAMLTKIGAASVEELFAGIPEAVRLRRALDVPPALSEQELAQHLAALSKRTQSAEDAVCFLGGGSYDHFIPAVVDAVSGRSEYYTAYTPYQAEASQGTLQAVFEFQTLVCQLTGLDVANASVYDGGNAVAEAVLMALNHAPKRDHVVIAGSVHPDYRQSLSTYVANLPVRIQTLPTPAGALDPDELAAAVTDQTACVVVQHPNFFGNLEVVQALADAAHARGALFIVSFDPISVGVLKRPAEYGADIAVAEGQCLGNPLSFGGPYLGLLACKTEFLRKMPGRLVGQTVDRRGKRCWVLTLQTREQHIRREKATSNICTNQGLFALRAAVYLTALGAQGLRETAELCLHKAHYAAEQLAKIDGVTLKFRQPFFKEFTVEVAGDVPTVLSRMRDAGFHAGLHLGTWYPEFENCLSVAVTEKRTRDEIDALATTLALQLGSVGAGPVRSAVA